MSDKIKKLNVPIDQVTGYEGEENYIVLVSGGKVKKVDLTEFMELRLKVHDDKISVIDITEKVKF